ncbi:hypothetical protein HNR19_003778 [Nocardioides thalensis]|uniref:PucR family transcriptional regulator n=1 Tax=Nocardioides thalensis TaxID=1914755 RepID=A0A853C4Q0_9ACTN|nr:PucR family transcriptional regulator [Nocardioides thalensis]NYJ03080.1 hypothetical protein [Nocardioides thalensis]
MAVRGRRAVASDGVVLPPTVEGDLRPRLPQLAEDVVAAIVDEVPSYENALNEEMGVVIRNAVRAAIGAFLAMVSGQPGRDPDKLLAQALDGAYQLGRGEASSGRTIDALLSAYRIGARISWRELSRTAVDHGSDPKTVAAFAEQVFAYIDQLSAASAQGHTDESATAGRVRQRLLERIATHVVDQAPEATILRLAERAEWKVPATLTAVLVPEGEAGRLLQALPGQTLQATDLPELDGTVLLLVPNVHGRPRGRVVRETTRSGGTVGPPRPWREARSSYLRALRAHEAGLGADTESHLPELVLTADAEALADLREQALAPLAGLRASTRAKLVETLRAWLLHQGRREEVAEALFVHPQTVRYRVGQLREAYGDALDDPRTVLTLTIALGVEA